MFAAGLLRRFLGALCRLLGDLLAALDDLLGGVLGLVLDLVFLEPSFSSSTRVEGMSRPATARM